MQATSPRLLTALCWLVLSAFSLPAISQALLSPDEFLRHKIGEQFTWHHEMVAYYEYVAAHSDRVQLWEYGLSAEGRPLLLAAVSSPENLSRLEELRQAHLRGASSNARSNDEVAIIWLSFGVHGNEAGATESAPPVLYELANPGNTESGAWLRNTIVLIDPCLNPDGNSRYTNWYRSVVGQTPNAAPHAQEHEEPWPGGRSNHYLFDLNRDWAWATQPETRQRLAKYQEWLPHIHIDFHEQFINEPYYFAPAAMPLHRYVSGWQQSFQTEIGLHNAAHFDEQGWLYFTREFFDLLYPSYGDTYPTFNGAIGMTYEQAGHGRAGLAIEIANGQTLRLAERVAHHTATALIGVRVASENAAQLNSNFRQYFERARSQPPGKYHTYIVHREGNTEAQLRALTEFLDLHKIQYGRAGVSTKTRGFLYHKGWKGDSQVREDDLLISSHQTQGILVQVLFEPETELEDSLTYDITSWALPFARGLAAVALEETWKPKGEFKLSSAARPAPLQEAYAYLLPWTSMRSARFLAALQQQDVVVRVAEKPFRTRDGQTLEPGTLLITRADNAGKEQLTQILQQAALESGVSLLSQNTGFSTTGPDLGSPSMRLLERPNILLLRGKGVQDNSFGYAWHYFDQVLHYPVTLVDADQLGSAPLDAYNLLVMPEGSYRFDEDLSEALNTWVQKGGRVLATGQALNSLRQWAGASLSPVEASTPKPPASYAERERHFLPDYTAGATVKVTLDASHPLAFGLGDTYFSLKTNSQTYKLLEQGWNVGRIGNELTHFGYMGQRLQERQLNSLQFGVESKGAGNLIYLVDDPLFRGFWERGHLLYANAVFFAGQ
jgi:hypothetical protein